MPTLIGVGGIQSLGLLHGGLTSSRSNESPEDRPRDASLFPEPDGVGQWAQQTYFQLLEAGLRIPPAAGSGADSSGNPLGYARTYVYCGDEFTAQRWWEGLRAGQVVLTNGPLLRPRVNGQLPGHVFRASAGETLRLQVDLKLSTQDKIRYLEVIQNGRPAIQVRLDEWVRRRGELPDVTFNASGWLLVRAIAEHPQAFRGAMSGPYYVEFDGQPRISRQAASYFHDWCYERARMWQRAAAPQRQAVLPDLRRARDFWQQRMAQANAD
jgi:hypothetical protein